jgi:type I restriction enzyme R subunit
VSPEQQARQQIDRLLAAAGWAVQDFKAADIHAARGVALREFVLDAGQGFADYLLYLDGKACGVVEAKKQGTTLTGVEIQSTRYAQGLPATLPAWRRPLPFVYESTGVETHFTNGLDPTPRARNVFAFHTPAHLGDLLSVPAGTTDLQSVTGATGERIEATPVLALPGWFVDRQGRGPVLVFSGSELRRHLLKARDSRPLSAEQMQRVVHQVEQRCRDVKPRYRPDEG